MLWTVVYQTQDTLGPYHLHIYTSPGGGGGELHTLCRTLHPF